ncbi:B12-binding domain-containing radical SAM protein [Patescibacteria group bacterium]|nr:B12-binding domain-containing radical SAM protein [Patescibacteria group bacterium]
MTKSRPAHVTLINPPSPFLLDERVFPPLGILRVAAVLEQKGYGVDLLDLSGFSNFTEILAQYLSQHDSRHIGISATTPQIPAAREVAETIRRLRPTTRIILGGPHGTLAVAAKKMEAKNGVSGRAHRAVSQLTKYFDVLVAGDGEDAVEQALTTNEFVVDADDPKSPMFLTNARLGELPLPARHLLDFGSYRYTIDGVPATSLIAQLGCPFKCGFCAGRLSPSLRRIRTRSTECIVAEMVHLYQAYGFRGFMFYDDELNVSKTMVELMRAITKAQRDLGVEWKLRGFVKAELFTPAQAEAMYEAGFRWLLTGFESGSPRILENIQKIATQEANSRCVEIARAAGLKVKALMSIGHPGESHETIRETEQWLLDIAPDDFDVTIITPYPGSPYYDEAVCVDPEKGHYAYTYKRNGDRLLQEEIDYLKEADYYKGNPDGGYVSHVWTDNLTREELVAERDRLETSLRKKLGIPFNPSAAAQRYEHSMGQTSLPTTILRSSGVLVL